MFDANKFLNSTTPQYNFPLGGVALGAGAGAGLGALFSKLVGGSMSPALIGLPAIAGGVIGGAAQMGNQARKNNAQYEQLLAQLYPEEYAAVMQEYGKRMHTTKYF